MADKSTDTPSSPKEDSIKNDLLTAVVVDPQDGLIHNDLTEGSNRYPDVFFDITPDEVIAVKQEDQDFFFTCKNQITLKVSILGNDIFRMRYSSTGDFQTDFSYALDPKFKPQQVGIDFSEKEEAYSIKTETTHCIINKSSLKVDFYNNQEEALCLEDQGYCGTRTILKGITNLAIHKKAPINEAYFGLGDKSRSTNLRGNKLQNWCTDAFAFNDTSDELYRAIPFYYGLHEGKAYGIFLDNSYRSHFDFDSKKTGSMSFSADGGEMNYYFINGPQLLDVAERYCQLTGRPELPAMWALGFHQCRWSYYPEQRVREVANEFRKRQIPCDSIYLDIDYMDGYRCFTWNKEHFPDPKGMIADLKDQGFQTVVMIDPGIKVDPEYDVYKSGKEKDVYCKRPDGELMTGPVWPSNCVFPDYTKAATREWWGPLYKELYVDQQVSGFWNDMNEPAVFKVDVKTFPDNIRHDHDGQPCSHAKVHNIYGLQMSRATQEGLAQLRPDRRPFVLTRATFCGGQRYASAWTGDNIASWEHLHLANIQCQRMSVSGFSFVGTDIGGFVDLPNDELMVRWLQLGIFHPLFRVHSMGNNADGSSEVDEDSVKKSESEIRMDQEPWAFGKTGEALGKAAIELRYRLLPYLYSAFWQNANHGTPMIKNLAFADQQNEIAVARENEFIFGEHMLVSPVTQKGISSKKVYLPKGKWYSYKTGQVFAGRQFLRVPTPLETIPMFIRAGAVIPHYPVMQYTGERPVDLLELSVYYGTNKTTSTLYEDNGEGYAHLEGEYALRHFETAGTLQQFSIKVNKSGQRQDTYAKCKIEVIGLPFKPTKCNTANGSIDFQESLINQVPVYTVWIENDFTELVFVCD